ncbi:MAG: fumarylacetoacetate hydrolase family protein [Deltaproteobacteria bacterium]|nr:fumarylacetoacetate hydrolase family protein [Deltaproteobacteria bacterium]MBW2362933.1 fumarylacetoacetate hydrolase family protein [Deltaproteobacteria bacterium]
MKLATFSCGNAPRIGVVIGDELVPLDAAAPELPTETCALLSAGSDALDTALSAAEAAATRLPLADVHLHAPILRPPKILAIGLNYADHIAETGRDAPKVPTVFNKQATAAVGPSDPIHRPRVSDKLDYEGELGFVVGRRCRHVPKERAHEVIAGFAIVNDVSVRDWQVASPTFTMGKSFDTHCPFGPWITTADEIPDPHALRLRTWVNDELRQDSNTRHLIFDCFALVEHLSTAFTLEPGDLISTGTPSGVGIGFQPRRFLAAGDTVRIEIEGLGRIENRVIEEPEDTTRI